ncbi:MAG: alpha/beta hydrolase-fold protein [Caldilineaceae bacterium]
MLRRYETIHSPAVGRPMQVLAFGHFGRPLIAFPSGGGQFYDFENNGMIDAIAHLIDAGKLKVYCPEGLDNESWLNQGIDPHWRAVRHNAYQDFILHDLVPAIRTDCRDEQVQIGLTGCSLGAYHAANFALKFPHIFPYALCMSGRYDLEKITGSSDSQDVYFNNPVAYVVNLHGDALEHVRHHAHLAGLRQGAWEDKCLEETNRLADLLAQKGISHERDLWGHDVEHHWYWWRKQIAQHLEKLTE